MRIALISDIHANLPALEAVLADIDARGDTDATYHLGDLVGYAPWPNETVSAVRAAGIPGVAGNYDSTVAADYKHCGCKYEDPQQEALSHESYAWTLANVSTETKQFLRSLPFRLDIRPLGGHAAGPSVILVHGNHVLNTVYVTEDRPDTFLAKMAEGLGARAGDVVLLWAYAQSLAAHGERCALREHRIRRPPEGRRFACRLRATDDRCGWRAHRDGADRL